MIGPVLDVPEPEVAHQPLHVQREESGGEDQDEEEYGASCGHLRALRAVGVRATTRASGSYPEGMTTTTEATAFGRAFGNRSLGESQAGLVRPDGYLGMAVGQR